jgi:hypothetical protein
MIATAIVVSLGIVVIVGHVISTVVKSGRRARRTIEQAQSEIQSIEGDRQ